LFKGLIFDGAKLKVKNRKIVAKKPIDMTVRLQVVFLEYNT
jgi:hypothetical protein